MKIATFLTLSLTLSLAFCGQHATADVVEDVESQTVDAAPELPFESPADATVRDDTTATPFGTGNQYVEVSSRIDGNSNGFRFFRCVDSVGATPIERIQFQVYFPSGNAAGTDPQFRNLFRMTIRGDETVNNMRSLRNYNINTVGGNITVDGTDDPANGSLAFDTVYDFDIIANISGSTFTNGSFDVADRTFDLFVNGVQVQDNFSLNQNTTANTNINEIGFWQQSDGGATTDPASQSTIFIDNVSFTSLSATPPVVKGDVDLSGVVDFADIPAFIGVLQSGGSQAEADCDCSTTVDFSDIPVFITILQGG